MGEQRPEAPAHQLQTESANYAHCKTANTYAMSLSTTDLGERHKLQQSRPSLQRAENYDFAITRKNNSWSAEDKLIRSDPYYMKPSLPSRTTASSTTFSGPKKRYLIAEPLVVFAYLQPEHLRERPCSSG